MTVNVTAGEEQARAFAAAEHGVVIDGEQVAGGAQTLDVEDPSTEEHLATVPLAGPDLVDRAVAAARGAFEDGRWAGLDPGEQQAAMLRLADLVELHAAELSALDALDNGKALVEARGDVAGTAAVLRYYAGWPTKLAGEVNPTDRRFLSYTLREPVGVCGQIVPWNYPLLMCSWKLGPALACGNTVVLKPAEQTPLSALRLAEIILEAGIPPGVVNVVTGDGPTTGAGLVAHPDVDKVAFTGSTEVGRTIMRGAADTVKRVTLELGGKNPNLIFADADLEYAVPRAMIGAFENGGQACIAGSRILVERAVHDEVVERLAALAGELRIGAPLDEETELGALVSAEQLSRVLGFVEQGEREGARVVTGGPLDRPGHFMRPTVVDRVEPSNVLAREEVFGPVVSVTPFEGAEQAVALANDTPYGLAAAVWTRDIGRAHHVARTLRAGTVWVNEYGSIRPEVSFGGQKQSGVGRELGAHALEAYTELKSVFVAL